MTLAEMFEQRRKLAAELATLDQKIEAEAMRPQTERSEYTESEPKLNLLVFKDKTLLLLTRLWNAPNRMLSNDDIREYVIFEGGATDNAVRLVINRAKEEMKAYPDCRYEIINKRNKGYLLVCKETFHNVSNSRKIRKKRYQKYETY